MSKKDRRILTAAWVRNIRPENKQVEISDGAARGLRLSVQPSGHKSWIMRFRQSNGKQYKLTLGPVDLFNEEKAGEPVIGQPLTLASARRLAADVWRARAMGRDVVSDYRAAKKRVNDSDIRTKIAAFREQGVTPAAFLYRQYDVADDLLYVGISIDGLQRSKQHLGKSKQRDLIYKITIEPFATREEALEAEQSAIRTEFPRFNTVLNNRDLAREIKQLGATGSPAEAKIIRLPVRPVRRTRVDSTGTADLARPVPEPVFESSTTDTMVPDALVAAELNVTLMTIARWDANPKMDERGWPPAIRFSETGQARKFRSRRALEQFKANLMKAAAEARSKLFKKEKTGDG